MSKIVIDPGHGGTDSGAIGNGIIEKDLNLKISKYIYERLKDLGLDVKITRNTDETLSPVERVNRVLNAYGNSSDVILLSNHINAGGGDGAEVIYALRNDDELPNLILEELAKEGQNIRKSYQRRLPSDFTKDYYFMQRNTGNTQSLTIEYGFLDGNGDDVEQLKNNWEKYAEAVVRAVAKYLNVSYNPIETLKYYTVVKGDTLWNIAKKNNVSVNDLKNINGLLSSNLQIGQTLEIPILNNDNKSEKKYTVQKGDTLYKIAKNNNVSISDIISLNNLISNILSIGQVLKIPQYNEEETYIVQKGDTLYSISKQYNTNIDNIIKLNNLTNNILKVGQEIKIK